jgi:retron-type reverse transcriptase
MTVLPFATQINNAGAAIEANSPIEGEVIFCVQGVLSPLLSNIMLHEFDAWREAKYLNGKARKDRWAWNFGIQQERPIAVRENRQWKPAVAYCRYADDCVPRTY